LGDAGWKNTLNSFSLLSSVLFIRAWEQGERLIVAMDSRCYDGKLDLMNQSSKAGPKGIFAAIGYLIGIATIAVLTRGIQLL
jgi:cobalt/nickel transport system permease protein